jgi:hypothetical protein
MANCKFLFVAAFLKGGFDSLPFPYSVQEAFLNRIVLWCLGSFQWNTSRNMLSADRAHCYMCYSLLFTVCIQGELLMLKRRSCCRLHWLGSSSVRRFYWIHIHMTNKLHGLSPRANYTDRATAACQRSDCQLSRMKGATWSAWRIPPVVFSVF